MSVLVELTLSEVLTAANIGIMRRLQDLKAKRQDRYGIKSKHNAWQVDLEGACGEMALAKHFSIFWSGQIGNLQADDVGTLQVRTTTYNDGCLILHPDDPDDRAFILITGSAPSYKIAGWIRARDGKIQEHWADPQHTQRFAFFVPQQRLRSIGELRNIQTRPAVQNAAHAPIAG